MEYLQQERSRKRNVNYCADEVAMLVKQVGCKRDVLLSKCANQSANCDKKHAWDHITAMVNAISHVHRTNAEIKKKWQDLCTRTKQKELERRKRFNGSSPSTMSEEDRKLYKGKCLTDIELEILRILGHVDMNGSTYDDLDARNTSCSSPLDGTQQYDDHRERLIVSAIMANHIGRGGARRADASIDYGQSYLAATAAGNAVLGEVTSEPEDIKPSLDELRSAVPLPPPGGHDPATTNGDVSDTQHSSDSTNHVSSASPMNRHAMFNIGEPYSASVYQERMLEIESKRLDVETARLEIDRKRLRLLKKIYKLHKKRKLDEIDDATVGELADSIA